MYIETTKILMGANNWDVETCWSKLQKEFEVHRLFLFYFIALSSNFCNAFQSNHFFQNLCKNEIGSLGLAAEG